MPSPELDVPVEPDPWEIGVPPELMLSRAIPGGNPGSLGWTDGPLLELLLLDESDGRPGSKAEPPLMAARPLPLPLKGGSILLEHDKKIQN